MTCLRFAPLLVGLAVALGSTGCQSQRVQVGRSQGPDGAADWKRISCPHLDKRCFATARQVCPGGYYFTKEKGRRARMSTDDVASGAPTPRAGVNAKRLPPQEKWGDEMYSREPGALYVRCADGTAAP